VAGEDASRYRVSVPPIVMKTTFHFCTLLESGIHEPSYSEHLIIGVLELSRAGAPGLEASGLARAWS